MSEQEILTMSTKDLIEKKSLLQNESEAIEYTIIKIQTELFYRDNPECKLK
jgi:hypothetical protein